MELENPADRAEVAANEARIVIEEVAPRLEGGRFAAKAIAHRASRIHARIFADGHDKLAAEVAWREGKGQPWQKTPLQHLGNDHWEADITPTRIGRTEFIVLAWIDSYASFRYELEKKYAAGQLLDLEFREGLDLFQEALHHAPQEGAAELGEILRSLQDTTEREARFGLFMAPRTLELMQSAEHRPHLTRSLTFELDVERPLAGFASWYELFPRSESPTPGQHGTFADVHRRLPEIAAMGFDVLYFPPIHPIGRTHRKGRNNSLQAGPDDPGSPYAIGSEEGGHDAVHPELGSLDDFRALVDAARGHGLEIALDFAIQCSPDHPWLREHPGWFSWRADGSIRHAENPPKKYEDIVNVDFYAADAIPDLWLGLLGVVQGWVEQGVNLFRVDNPHTKPLPFWQWLIAEIHARHPDVLFLSEAFTRPKMMYRLAKVGFTQSYTYFTWRNDKAELEDYLREISQPPAADFFRPHFFVNTPDINPLFLQTSGRPGFLIRAALAALGSGLWGVYSGFELCEAAPVPGKEEYLDSEKYELRPRDWRQPGNIRADIARLNQLRRANPALQSHRGLTLAASGNARVIAFAKATPGQGNVILAAISLDPFHAQTARIEPPYALFCPPWAAEMVAEDLLAERRETWRGGAREVALSPEQPYRIWRLSRHG